MSLHEKAIQKIRAKLFESYSPTKLLIARLALLRNVRFLGVRTDASFAFGPHGSKVYHADSDGDIYIHLRKKWGNANEWANNGDVRFFVDTHL